MSASEFDIIRRYFLSEQSRDDVELGIGDDCALLVPPSGMQLATTVDSLVAGVHFPLDTTPEDIAYKSIAVNLSDLAAMGATPAWLTLALTLPESNEAWLQAFADSFHNTATSYGVSLVGGDTTRGPLSITVQATGFVEPGTSLRRDAAKPGDAIYVTGTLGDAALGLRLQQAKLTAGEAGADVDFLLTRLNRPVPRVEFGRELTTFARCAIDISDGLLADLGHIVQASACGARLMLADVPVSEALQSIYRNNSESVDMQSVLTGGDDYELCFTLDPDRAESVIQCAREHNIRLTRVGEITGSAGIVCIGSAGQVCEYTATGYQHF